MKKLIVIVLLICLFGNIVHAGNRELINQRDMLIEIGIIDKSYFSNVNTVSRKECLIAIMRVIGVTDEEVSFLNGADFYAFADTAAYSYFGCAYAAKIAYGEEHAVDYPTYRTTHTRKNTEYFFFPERDVTVKETLAFMIRCLESNESSYEETFDKAKEYKLVNDNDELDLDSNISQDDFCVLLERLLQSKRYKYYGRENNIFEMGGNVDKERSISYFDMKK